jgi:ADP-ribosylglycohydrolase
LPEYLNNIKIDSIEDRVYGCIFGQLIGDALGSYLEYTREQINEDVVNLALNMPGGGMFNLSPGQVHNYYNIVR